MAPVDRLGLAFVVADPGQVTSQAPERDRAAMRREVNVAVDAPVEVDAALSAYAARAVAVSVFETLPMRKRVCAVTGRRDPKSA